MPFQHERHTTSHCCQKLSVGFYSFFSANNSSFTSTTSNLNIAKLEFTNIMEFREPIQESNLMSAQTTSQSTQSPLDEMQMHATQAANLLKALANENRLMIMCTLLNGELSVGELNAKVPLSQSALSQHLASLRDAGLVSTRKEAQTVYYQVCGDEASKIIAVLQSIYCPTI
jgi:DNA-binding transcriptional ArsR family regulator